MLFTSRSRTQQKPIDPYRPRVPAVAAPVIPKRLRRLVALIWSAVTVCRSTRDSKEIEAASRKASSPATPRRSTRDSKEIEAVFQGRSHKGGGMSQHP